MIHEQLNKLSSNLSSLHMNNNINVKMQRTFLELKTQKLA
jgi:hypothetical protein